MDKVGTAVTMLGDTLSTASTTGPLGSLTNTLGGQVLVPVVSLVENTTGNLGTATGLGTPVSGVLDKVGTTVASLGTQVTTAGGASNPVTNVVGGVLTGVGGALDTSGGYVAPTGGTAAAAGLPELIGGVVANVGTGLNAGNTNGTSVQPV